MSRGAANYAVLAARNEAGNAREMLHSVQRSRAALAPTRVRDDQEQIDVIGEGALGWRRCVCWLSGVT